MTKPSQYEPEPTPEAQQHSEARMHLVSQKQEETKEQFDKRKQPLATQLTPRQHVINIGTSRFNLTTRYHTR